MGQKRQFRWAAVQIGCCLLAFWVVGARLGAQTGQGILDGVTITQIILTPSDTFTADVAPDSGGNVWFIGSIGPTSPQVGYFTPDGAVTAYPLLNVGTDLTIPQAIAKGADGNFWFSYVLLNGMSPDGSGIGRVTPSGVVTRFPLVTPYACVAGCAMTLGHDGNIWVAEKANYKIGKITPTGAITEYATPFPHSPIDIVTGPDNKLYAVYAKGVDQCTTSGSFITFANPSADPLLQHIASASDGNLYVTDSGNNAIWGLTTSGSWTQFPIPTAASIPSGIALSKDGKTIYCAAPGTGKFVQFDRSSSTFNESPMPSSAIPTLVRASQTTDPVAYVVGLVNFDPRVFRVRVGSGPAPTPTTIPYCEGSGVATATCTPKPAFTSTPTPPAIFIRLHVTPLPPDPVATVPAPGRD